MTSEQTYIMVKPDGVQRGLVGEIMKRFEQKGYKLIGLKLFSPTKDLLEKHYADLSKKAFFPGLIEYMASAPAPTPSNLPSTKSASGSPKASSNGLPTPPPGSTNKLVGADVPSATLVLS